MSDFKTSSDRERPTDPMGLTPPPSSSGTPPEEIEGAPPYFRLLIRKLDQVLANQALQREDQSTFKMEMRGHLRNVDVEIQWLKDGQKTLDEVTCGHGEELRDYRRRIVVLEEDMRARQDDGK